MCRRAITYAQFDKKELPVALAQNIIQCIELWQIPYCCFGI